MSKRSLSVIDLRKTSTVNGAIETVYSNLCTALTQWSDFPGLEDRSSVHLELEQKLGGRLSAFWKTEEGDGSEVLLGTVCAYSRPTLLRITGPLCIEHSLSTALISFELKSLGDKTRVVVRHEATGTLDDKALNDKWSTAWKNFFALLKSLAVVDVNQPINSNCVQNLKSETIAERAIKLLDAVDFELKDNGTGWHLALKRFESTANRVLSTDQRFAQYAKQSSKHDEFADESQNKLEEAYQELQSRLIQVRMAVATSIATEKQLQHQLQKSNEEAQRWLDRAAMSMQQGNPELASQASQRRKQHVEAAEALEIQLVELVKSTSIMRQQLTDLESTVQKAYTSKQVLIARSKSAAAMLAANECLNNFESADLNDAMAKVESSVLELEAQARKKGQESLANPSAIVFSPESLAEAIVTLEVLLEKFTEIARQIAVAEGDTKDPDSR